MGVQRGVSVERYRTGRVGRKQHNDNKQQRGKREECELAKEKERVAKGRAACHVITLVNRKARWVETKRKGKALSQDTREAGRGRAERLRGPNKVRGFQGAAIEELGR